MQTHTMFPKEFTVRFYNHAGEIDFEVTQVTFLTTEQLVEQTALAIEDNAKAKGISKVEVIEL